MIALIRIIGILIFCMGIAIAVKPAVARKMMAFWLKGNNLYMGAAIRLLLGALLLVSVSAAQSPGIMLILGILAILGGITIIVLGPARIRPILDRYIGKPDSFLRLLALAILAFGALLVYSA